MSLYQGKDADFHVFIIRSEEAVAGDEIPEGYVQVNLKWNTDDPDEADERNDSKNVPARHVAEVVNEHRPEEVAVAEALREEIFPSKDRFRDGKMGVDVISYQTFRKEYLRAVGEAIGSPYFNLEGTIEKGGIPGLPARPGDVDAPEEKLQEVLNYLQRESALDMFYRTGAVIVTSGEWTHDGHGLAYIIDDHWDEARGIGYVVPASTLESL